MIQKIFIKQKKKIIDFKIKLMVTKGETVEGERNKSGGGIGLAYTHYYALNQWMEVTRYSMPRSTQYSLIIYMGKKNGYMYTYV